MKFGWWSVPSKIDVRNTTFVQIPVLHGEAGNGPPVQPVSRWGLYDGYIMLYIYIE
jgi:hypothetical protein